MKLCPCAVRTGFQPSISSVTVRRPLQAGPTDRIKHAASHQLGVACQISVVAEITPFPTDPSYLHSIEVRPSRFGTYPLLPFRNSRLPSLPFLLRGIAQYRSSFTRLFDLPSALRACNFGLTACLKVCLLNQISWPCELSWYVGGGQPR